MFRSEFITPHSSLRKINNVLFLSTLLLGLYIIIAPALPELTFSAKPFIQTFKNFLGFQSSEVVFVNSSSVGPEEVIPVDNTLVIPKIEVNGIIYEGKSANILERGMWHRPKSSTPDKGGNTVFVAHRFLYTSGPNTFYHLDKLKVNDEFIVYWQSKKYLYKVFEVTTVPATAFEIEAPTSDSIVTLWTCTPIFTATNRLVVKGKLIPS